MKSQSSPKRPNGGVPGTKALITAGALAATLGGWILFGLRGPAGGTVSTSPQTAKVSPQLASLLEPLPTLMPPPAQMAGAGMGVAQAPLRQVLRSVTVPLPAPVTITRSSR